MTFAIFFQTIALVVFLAGGILAHSQWADNKATERLIFSILNFVGAGVAFGLILAALLK